MKCPFCGSERIEEGISWGLSDEGGNVGLNFQAGGFLKIIGTVQVYSDLCLDCKALLKTYIRDDTERQWHHKPGALGSK
ncbi:MAG: hypothetical protein IJU78_01380 [Clostridia bacterium]|nr:hypothetical protein [Clostridia bacterium]